jgi:guanine deaminase
MSTSSPLPDSPSAPAARLALLGDLLDFTGDPGLDDPHSNAVRFRADHWLLIEDGRIVGAQPATQLPDPSWTRRDYSGLLITPGLIDTHVHSPQLDVIASYGTELLDWLNNYTFPAEGRYVDKEAAELGAAYFLDALFACGTTSAVVFPTVHKASAEALFAAARQRGMRLIAGKILMDRFAPEGLLDDSTDVSVAERECVDLIERWHGTGRLAYAVTPRFAPTSSDAQLAMAGRLCAAWPDIYMQTHVAENRAEVKWVHELFPDARSYLDVYAGHGLLHSRSVLAHGIWLDDADRAAIGEAGAQIAFCPSSNLFLGSGLFNWQQAIDAGVNVSIATDVGGGTSLSLLRTMADGYKVQAMLGHRLTAWKALHGCTLGAATALGLANEIGSLAPGTMADVAVWDLATGPVPVQRLSVARTLHEKIFAWMTLGDERNLVATYVAGGAVYTR